MLKKAFIYSLSDPITEEVRYIGKTTNIQRRYWQHLSDANSKGKNLYKINWLISLKNKGLNPTIEIVDFIPLEEWEFWEIHYISLYKSWGFRLTNLTEGGNNCQIINRKGFNKGNSTYIKTGKRKGKPKGFKHSEETKLKIKEARSKQIITNTHKDAISKSNTGKKKSCTINMGKTLRKKIKEIKVDGTEIIWDSLVNLLKYYNFSDGKFRNLIKNQEKKKLKSKFYYLKQNNI